MDEKVQKTILIYLAFIVVCVIAGIALSLFGGPLYQPSEASVEAPAKAATP